MARGAARPRRRDIAPIGYEEGGVAPPAAVGGAALLEGETDGFGADFTHAVDAERIAAKFSGVVMSYGVDAFYANSGTIPKLVWDGSALSWSPHNLFLNSETPATQTVTTLSGETYTVIVTGSGSLTGSSAASGVATQASPLTYVGGGTGTSIFTLAGSLTRIQINRGGVATAYLATTAARRHSVGIDYLPSIGKSAMLVESTGTNLGLWSSDFTQAAWVKTNLTAAKTATGPEGWANGASTLTATAANATALQAITSTSQARITSVFLKRRTGTGNVDVTQDNGTTWTTQAITSSWARYALPAVTSANPTVGIRIVTSGDAVDVAHLQHEQATNGVTSPYPSFATAGAKAADNYSFLLSQIPALGSEFSIYVRFSTPLPTGGRRVACVGDGTANEHAGFLVNTTVQLAVTDGGSAVGSIVGPAVTAFVPLSAAARFKLNDLAMSVNGAAAGTDVTATLPAVTSMFHSVTGASGAASQYFRIEKLVIVPRAWSNVELQAWSAS